jgi:hypothetical protein
MPAFGQNPVTEQGPVMPRLQYRIALLLVLASCAVPSAAQINPNDEMGQWTMLFFSQSLGDSRWVLQGDAQNRTREIGKDMEQQLLRSSIGYRLQGSSLTLAQGYAWVRSEGFGPTQRDSIEHRSYQEALLPQRLGRRLYLTHRLRTEQRWVEGQDFRTRIRYFLGANMPLNRDTLEPGAIYLAFYNEFMINGERDIGGGRRVDRLDRNRLYGALGFSVAPGVRLQAGVLRQNAEDLAKSQIQLGVHLNF